MCIACWSSGCFGIHCNTQPTVNIKPVYLFENVTQLTRQHQKMENSLRVGQRIRVGSNQVASVRYIGGLDGHPGTVWVGLEWDDPSRGKHDGSLNGRRYFSCRFGADHASFIKMSRLLASCSVGIPIADAMRERYISGHHTPGVDVAAHPTPTWDALLLQDKLALPRLDVSDVVRIGVITHTHTRFHPHSTRSRAHLRQRRTSTCRTTCYGTPAPSTTSFSSYPPSRPSTSRTTALSRPSLTSYLPTSCVFWCSTRPCCRGTTHCVLHGTCRTWRSCMRVPTP